MLHGLIAFLVFFLILCVVVYILFIVIDIVAGWIGVPQVAIIAKLIVGLLALLAVLDRGLPLLGFSAGF